MRTALGFTNPITNKTYKLIHTGFTPTSKISSVCKRDYHAQCGDAPQTLFTNSGYDLEFVKRHCCLCECHFEGVNA